MAEGGRGGIRKKESKSFLLQRMESGRENEERTGKMKKNGEDQRISEISVEI